MNSNKEFNKLFSIGAFFIFLSIVLGAFGAHLLKDILSKYYLEVYEKAVFYQVTQSLGILILGLCFKVTEKQYYKYAIYILTLGIIIFCGSLYLLTLTKIKIFGAITPIGGTLMIIAWGFLLFKLIREK